MSLALIGEVDGEHDQKEPLKVMRDYLTMAKRTLSLRIGTVEPCH